MLEVRGLPILVDEVEILQTIREQVLLQQGREILHKIKRSGNNIMVCCPIHNDGQERKPSCGISIVKRKDYPPGTWNCFSCGEKGPFELFVAKCFGKDDVSFGTKWLMDNFVTGEVYERPDMPMDYLREPPKKVEVKYVDEQELASYRFYHPYMYQRKLTNEVIEKYDVGYQKDYVVFEDKNTGYKKFDEVLTFPVRDKHGNCLFVSRRSINNKNFYLPSNMEKPVYGVYELPQNCTEAVICESVFNALTCVAYGRPAVALFGTGADEQFKQLNELPIKHYILGLDPDKAGAKGTWKLKQHLKNKLLTKYVIPYGKDINDLSYQEFLSLPEIFI